MKEPDGVLLLDKPAGFSSTQALARAKRHLASRKAGHTGTLDPFATGLLPLAFGEATKFSRFLIDAAKGYRATLQLGRETTTGDTEGTVCFESAVDVDEAAIDAALAKFRGVQDQVPPMHSAVHVGGKRLYELAREGLEVERAARRVEVYSLQRVEWQGDVLVVDVSCSKGTYIRTLAMDIGRALGCGAYLTALRRTVVGDFTLAQASTLESLERAGPEGARRHLLPLEVMIRGLPRWQGSAGEALRFTQGQGVACDSALPGEDFAIFDPAGHFLGVGRCERPGRLAPLRLLATGGEREMPDSA